MTAPGRARARNILRHGDPLAFLLAAFNKAHVGDRTVAECLIMSIASQSVANTKGLHVAISGNSGAARYPSGASGGSPRSRTRATTR